MVGANVISNVDVKDMQEVYAAFMRLKANKASIDISIISVPNKKGKEED